MAAFAWLGGPITTGVYGCGAEQNVTGYCQRLVTADLNQADRILDEEQRARALNRVDRRLAKRRSRDPALSDAGYRRISGDDQERREVCQ